MLTLGGLALCQNKGIKAIRTVAVTGASVLMALALYLVYYFLQQRGAGNNAEMLLTQRGLGMLHLISNWPLASTACRWP